MRLKFYLMRIFIWLLWFISKPFCWWFGHDWTYYTAATKNKCYFCGKGVSMKEIINWDERNDE